MAEQLGENVEIWKKCGKNTLGRSPKSFRNKNSHSVQDYPSSHWIRIYTDGSATEAVRKYGAGLMIH